MGEHTGRVALVTGGAKGIGEAIVDRLAAQGATIAIVDIDAEAGTAKAAALLEGGTRAAPGASTSPGAPRSSEPSRRSRPISARSTFSSTTPG